jgi:hypothetical protein
MLFIQMTPHVSFMTIWACCPICPICGWRVSDWQIRSEIGEQISGVASFCFFFYQISLQMSIAIPPKFQSKRESSQYSSESGTIKYFRVLGIRRLLHWLMWIAQKGRIIHFHLHSEKSSQWLLSKNQSIVRFLC